MAKRYQDLVAWQLADELRGRVVAFTSEAPAKHDRRFSDHIRESASSVPSNLAEGFCRYHHKEFARFVAIARASLAETEVRIRDAAGRHYLVESSYLELLRLSRRRMVATTRLLTYLRTHPDPVSK